MERMFRTFDLMSEINAGIIWFMNFILRFTFKWLIHKHLVMVPDQDHVVLRMVQELNKAKKGQFFQSSEKSDMLGYVVACFG